MQTSDSRHKESQHPERLKQRDALKVSDGRLYSSLTFVLIMYKDSLKRSYCLCKEKKDSLLHKLHGEERKGIENKPVLPC